MVTLKDIQAAQQRIAGVALRTPLLPYPRLVGDRQLYLKCENFQPIGSFKLRGAYNMAASLSAEQRAKGIIAHSSGNHAQGVAYAAKALGCHATIVVPNSIPQVKLEATKSYGSEVVIVGPNSQDRIERADQLVAEKGYTLVPPYDDERIIAGQGTCGLEILEQLPDVECVLSPVSGGGLISGIAAAIKLSNPKVKVIGVEPELAGDAAASFAAKERLTWPAEKVTSTIADGLRTSPVGKIPWEHIKTYVDDFVTVTEEEIRASVKMLLYNGRILAEPSGAVTAAAVFFHGERLPKAQKLVAVVSGGNIAPEILQSIVG